MIDWLMLPETSADHSSKAEQGDSYNTMIHATPVQQSVV